MAVLVSPFRQSRADPLAGHKTTNYLPRLLALRAAQAARCGEALWFTPENRLAEGSVSNIFLVKDSVLKTPPRDTPVLPGITRAVVIESAQAVGIEVRETSLDIDDLLDADEVFITNTGMEVVPVIRVEKHDIGNGQPGPIARDLLDHYRIRVEKECSGGDG
jgi:branched-chain amino acid aminotransferase